MPFTDPFVANPYPYAFAVTIPTTTLPYEIVENFVSGVYTISWSGGGTLQVDFYNGNTFIGSAIGTSSITYNLAQSATKAVLWNSIAGVSVVLSLTALAAAPISGVLYTYSASGTPGLVGDAYCVLVGAAGGSSNFSGGSGAIQTFRATLTGVEAFVCGVAGTPGNAGGSPLATDGTLSSFAGVTSPGGTAGNTGVPGIGGTPNGVNGINGVNGSGNTTATAAIISGWSFFNQGSTGTGSCVTGYAPGGLGIGKGGQGSNTGPGGNASGFGASGGGSTFGGLGGLSTGGVLYVILVA